MHNEVELMWTHLQRLREINILNSSENLYKHVLGCLVRSSAYLTLIRLLYLYNVQSLIEERLRNYPRIATVMSAISGKELPEADVREFILKMDNSPYIFLPILNCIFF